MLFVLLLSNRFCFKTSYIIRQKLPQFQSINFKIGHTRTPLKHFSTNFSNMGCISSSQSQELQNSPKTLGNESVTKTEKVVKDNNLSESSIKNVQAPPTISNRACFGAGCYWGTEKFFKVNFQRQMFPESLIKGKVGFMGPPGSKANPTYKEVCSGSTGCVEVYDLTYEGGADMYRELVRFFFQFHDPTTMNQQGNDRGTQYASVIFVYDNIQKQIALDVIKQLQKNLDSSKLSCFKGAQVTTAVLDHTEFYEAHEEHQEYLSKNTNGYCNHRIRFKEWPSDM